MSESHVSPLDDEPKTPMWLPALGAALFVAVALWWAVTPSSAPPIAPEPAASASAAVAAAQAPAPSPSPLQAQAAPPSQPMATARPALSAGKVDPKVTERLRKLRDQIELKAPGARR